MLRHDAPAQSHFIHPIKPNPDVVTIRDMIAALVRGQQGAINVRAMNNKTVVDPDRPFKRDKETGQMVPNYLTYLTLWPNTDWSRLDLLEGVPDVYIVPSECDGVELFRGRKKRTGWCKADNLSGLNAIFIDVDFHDGPEGCSLDAQSIRRAADHMIAYLVDEGVPQPYCAVISGRGFHLWWRLKRVNAGLQAVWRAVVERINAHAVQAIKTYPDDLRAWAKLDTTNLNPVQPIRAWGCPNGKTGAVPAAEIIDDGDDSIYHISDLHAMMPRAYIPPRTMAEIKADEAYTRAEEDVTRMIDDAVEEVRKNPTHANLTCKHISNWYQAVYDDLLLFAEALWGEDIRCGRGIPCGDRDKFLLRLTMCLTRFKKAHEVSPLVRTLAQRLMPEFAKTGEDLDYMSSTIKRAIRTEESLRTGIKVDERYKPSKDYFVDYLKEVLVEYYTDPTTRHVDDAAIAAMLGYLEPRFKGLVSVEEKSKRNRARNQANYQERVAAAGKTYTPRAESLSRSKPWEALGIGKTKFNACRKSGEIVEINDENGRRFAWAPDLEVEEKQQPAVTIEKVPEAVVQSVAKVLEPLRADFIASIAPPPGFTPTSVPTGVQDTDLTWADFEEIDETEQDLWEMSPDFGGG